MRPHRTSRILTALAAAAVTAACGESTAPEIEVELDTEAALEDYAELASVLSSGELAGFQALGRRTPFGGGPAAVDAVAGMGAPSARDGGRAFALSLFRRIRPGKSSTDGPMSAPVISDHHRGATFVYDADADEYVVDPEREGAPETGVRFVIYEVDDAGYPIPEEERGFADLVDEGDESTEDIALRLTVVDREATVLEYATTLTGTETEGHLTVAGYMQGDRVRLDFEIDATGRDGGVVERLDLGFELRIDTRDFAVVGSVSGVGEESDGDGEIDISVRHRTVSLRVDVAEIGGTLEGAIYLNGRVFATVSGPEDDPIFLRADGTPLRLGELLVLHRMFDTVEDVFDFLEDLLDPVDELVILGIVL